MDLFFGNAVPAPFKPLILDGVVTSGLGTRVAFQWIQDRWPDIVRAPDVAPVDILTGLAAKMTSRSQIEALRAWLAEPTRTRYLEAVEPVLAAALITAAWAERDLKVLNEWLAKVT